MNARVALGLVSAAVLGVSMTAQQPTHLNPMVDLLVAKKGIFGVGVPTAGRGGGGGNRGGGAPGAAGGATSGSLSVPTPPAPTPTTPPPAPKTPAELAAGAIAHPEADYFFTAMMERNIDAGSATMMALQEAIAAAGPISTTSPKRLRMPVTSKAPNISAHACMCTSAVGVMTPSRSNSTAA